MNLRKTLTEAQSILEANGISHALIGGFALAAYGHHRTTSDIDFLADGNKKELIKSVFQAKGFTLKFESPEVLHFGGLGSVDILLANRPVSQQMLNECVLNKELAVHILKPEDIIGLKIQAYKNDKSREMQDKADIQNLLKVEGIDMARVKKYADLFEEWPVIQELTQR